jgi:hypothetical protein
MDIAAFANITDFQSNKFSLNHIRSAPFLLVSISNQLEITDSDPTFSHIAPVIEQLEGLLSQICRSQDAYFHSAITACDKYFSWSCFGIATILLRYSKGSSSGVLREIP